MVQRKRLIVTGASGFIGRNLLLETSPDWEVVGLYHTDQSFPGWLNDTGLTHVTAIHCDLRDREVVHRLPGWMDVCFDACVFLAANSNPVRSVWNPVYDLESNAMTLLNFLDNFDAKRFVYLSSGAVYDGLSGKVSPNSLVHPRLPYAISKWACEHYVAARAHDYVNLRFFGAYGPYEPERKLYTKLVRRFAFEKIPEFTVRGDGHNYVDAMYVEDAVRGILTVIRGDHTGTVDFCSGMPHTIDGLVRRAGKIFGFDDVEINHEGETAEHIEFRASPDAMRSFYGFSPRVSHGTGLLKLADFLREKQSGMA